MTFRIFSIGAALLTLAGSALAEPALTPLKANLQQGGFWVAKVAPGVTLALNGTPLQTGADGTVVVGFPRDAAPRQELRVCLEEGLCEAHVLKVVSRNYVTQKVTKIEKNKVEPNATEQAQMEEDNKATQAARTEALQALAAEPFALAGVVKLPLNAPTSGVFGSRRTYNGQERSWHKGHDLAAKTGTPVQAPADGVVRLARPTFMSGNLIMLDHGGGITTLYAHLSRMDVAAGQTVKAGDIIGRVGTTGRSSGPHLHWGMYWQNVPIDPILWVDRRPN